tara:strand:- start:262 stop:861 length:600 start_codon:yes stop_codon:yes gene_type:complete
MFKFQNISNLKPYEYFHDCFENAIKNKQRIIEAMVVSSFSKRLNQTNSRFVNLKIIKDKDFIFFSNYESLKAQDFKDNDRISCLLHWDSIKLQIRMNGTVKKTSQEFSNNYFYNREISKNILAASSNQSRIVKSYEEVVKKYNSVKKELKNLKRPDYWGGYSFRPYYFEFWEGHDYRINKRKVFSLNKDSSWKEYYLEP